jgi:hypothetical protein
VQEVAAAFIEDPQHAGVVIGNDRPALTLQEGLGIADGDLGEDLPVDLDTSGRCRGVDAIVTSSGPRQSPTRRLVSPRRRKP